MNELLVIKIIGWTLLIFALWHWYAIVFMGNSALSKLWKDRKEEVYWKRWRFVRDEQLNEILDKIDNKETLTENELKRYFLIENSTSHVHQDQDAKANFAVFAGIIGAILLSIVY